MYFLNLPVDLSAPAAVIVLAFLILGVLHGAELLGIVTIPWRRHLNEWTS